MVALCWLWVRTQFHSYFGQPLPSEGTILSVRWLDSMSRTATCSKNSSKWSWWYLLPGVRAVWNSKFGKQGVGPALLWRSRRPASGNKIFQNCLGIRFSKLSGNKIFKIVSMSLADPGALSTGEALLVVVTEVHGNPFCIKHLPSTPGQVTVAINTNIIVTLITNMFTLDSGQCPPLEQVCWQCR